MKRQFAKRLQRKLIYVWELDIKNRDDHTFSRLLKEIRDEKDA